METIGEEHFRRELQGEISRAVARYEKRVPQQIVVRLAMTRINDELHEVQAITVLRHDGVKSYSSSEIYVEKAHEYSEPPKKRKK